MFYRVRKQLVEEGFEAVLSRKQRTTPAVLRGQADRLGMLQHTCLPQSRPGPSFDREDGIDPPKLRSTHHCPHNLSSCLYLGFTTLSQMHIIRYVTGARFLVRAHLNFHQGVRNEQAA
jgi:hypothetical protein